MIHEIAEAVRGGRITPRELVEESIRRIETLDPALNAVVALRADEALADADSHSRTGPLAGVPMLVKSLLDVRGMVNTHGGFAPSAHDEPALRTDPSMEALESQGAIILGLSNSPGFGLLGITTNALFGPTRNPWNTSKTPGGSSGGAAASLAAGMVPLSGSSDGGGSSRMPAAACGLVGLKPTSNAFRSSWPPNPGWASNGAMGTTVADVVLEANCLAGATPGDPNGMPKGAVDFTPRRPRRAYAVSSLRHKLPTPDLQREFDKACALLADDLGIEVVPISRPFPDDLIHNFELVFNANLRHLMNKTGVPFEQFEPAQQWAYNYSNDYAPIDLMSALHGRSIINGILEELLGPEEVLISLPINIRIPGALGVPDDVDPNDMDAAMAVLEEELDGAGNTMDFNLAGAPACVVPIGYDDEGMPVALQVAARRFDDGLTLGLAREIEIARPWPLSAPGYAPFSLDTI